MEKIAEDIEMATINGIDINSQKSMAKLKATLELLTTGDTFFCRFSRENFFLDESDILKYRSEVPGYLRKNGIYKVISKRDEERFGSICKIPVNQNNYQILLKSWMYFEYMSFFSPNCLLEWSRYEVIFDKIEPEQYGIGLIQKGFTDSVFIKGYDGDHLIFSYGRNSNKELIARALVKIGDM